MVEENMCHILLHLNMRLMPADRGALFEDPLDDVMHRNDIGRLVGGGTFLSNDKVPISCNIEFNVKKDKINDIILLLKSVNKIAKGSYIEYKNKKEEIGTLEGLSLVIDGIDHNDDDIISVIKETNNLLKGKGEYCSYYIGDKNTNLYYYGNSFEEMKEIINNYVKTSLLCKNSIIERI